MVADRILDEARGLEAGEAVLGLALEVRVADEHGQHQLDAVEDVVGRDLLRLLVADQLTERAEALGQGSAEAGLVRSAVGRRDGVAVIAFGAVRIERPGDGPFGAALRRAVGCGEFLLPDEGLVGDGGALAELLGEMIGKAARELEGGAFGYVGGGERGVAAPADLDAGEEVGLGPHEAEEAAGIEVGLGAEDLRIRSEGDGRAALVRGRADLFQWGDGEPLREGLAVELLVAGDFDDRLGREGVDHADSDAVEAARGAVRLALELTARVEGGHDDFQRGLAWVLWVRVDRDSAAVVEDGQAVARLQRDLDSTGVAGDRLVHRIVDDLGGEVVKGARVGAADVHAGAAADGLQALEDLDR